MSPQSTRLLQIASEPLRTETSFNKKRCDMVVGGLWYCWVVSRAVEIINLTLPFNFNCWAFGHTETLPQKFKAFLIQWLCQDVCNLFLSPAMF